MFVTEQAAPTLNRRIEAGVTAFRSVVESMVAMYARDDPTSSDLARLYAVSVTAHAAATIRAESVAEIPYQVVDKQGKPLPDHPLQSILQDNHHDRMLRTELTLCFWGHNLLVKQRMLSRRVTGLEWLNPRLYSKDVSYTHGLRGFRVSAGREQDIATYIARPDGVFMTGVDFDDDYGGVSPAENAFDMAGVETEAALTALWFLRNRAIPAGMVQPADEGAAPDKQARRRLQELIQRAVKGARNAGQTIVSSGRWEWVQLQQQFDEIALPELHKVARESVSMSFRVPLDMLLPTTSTYAQAYQADAGWVAHWLKPRCNWYAGIYTLELAREYSDDIRIEPDFSVIKADEKALTEVAGAQVQGSYLSLYGAQVKVGMPKPDERLRDIYVIGGQPRHVEAIVQQARAAIAAPLPEPGGNGGLSQLPSISEPPKLPPRPLAAPSVTRSAGSESLAAPIELQVLYEVDRLPEAVYKELRDCVRVTARRGVDYNFEAHALPSDVVARVRLLLATGMEPDGVVADAKAYYLTQEQDLFQLRAFADVERSYRQTLYDLIRRAFTHKIERAPFGDLGRAEISTAFESAYRHGLHDAGVAVETLEEGEQAFVSEQAMAERRYWTALANDLYRNVLPLHCEALAKQLQSLSTAATPQEANAIRAETLELLGQFYRQRDDFLRRVDNWGKSLRGIYHQGMTAGRANPMLIWTLGQTEEHCRTCLAATDQVHRASTWGRYDLEPQGECLFCSWGEGERALGCDCHLEVTNEPARGRIDRIPLYLGGQKSTGGGDPATRSSCGPPAGTVVLHLAGIEDLLKIQQVLQRGVPADAPVRWTSIEHLHLTLAHAALVDELPFREAYQEVASTFKTLSLKADSIGRFEDGSDDSPIAVVLFVDETPELAALQQKVCQALTTRGVTLSVYSEPSAWKPHVTLGYFDRTALPVKTFDMPAVEGSFQGDALSFTREDYERLFTAEPAALPVAEPAAEPEQVETEVADVHS